MKRSLLLLILVLLASVAMFQGAHWVACRLCAARAAESLDDLQWLRMEFQLQEAELTRIRQLHNGYLPQCRQYCQQIADKKAALGKLLENGGTADATKETLHEIAMLRVDCQTEMLRHFEAVSREMPPAQGARYLAKMRELTLGSHERVEKSMAAPAAAAPHAHH